MTYEYIRVLHTRESDTNAYEQHAGNIRIHTNKKAKKKVKKFRLDAGKFLRMQQVARIKNWSIVPT